MASITISAPYTFWLKTYHPAKSKVFLTSSTMNRAQIFWANRNAQMDYPRARAAGYGAPALSNYCKGGGKQQNQNKGSARAAGYGAPALSNFCKGGGKQQNKNKGSGTKGRSAPFATTPTRFNTSGDQRIRQGVTPLARPLPPRPQSFQTFMRERYAEARPKSQPLPKREATPVAAKVDTAPAKTKRLIGIMQSKLKQKISKMLEHQADKSSIDMPPPKKKAKGKGKGKGKGKADKGKGKKEAEAKETPKASSPFEVPMEVESKATSSKSHAVDSNLDKPLSQIIAETMPEEAKDAKAEDAKKYPPPYPAPNLEAKGNTQYALGELTLQQFHALDELQEMIEQHIDDDHNRRVTQADLMTYSQRLMSIANMAGRTC